MFVIIYLQTLARVVLSPYKVLHCKFQWFTFYRHQTKTYSRQPCCG